MKRHDLPREQRILQEAWTEFKPAFGKALRSNTSWLSLGLRVGTILVAVLMFNRVMGENILRGLVQTEPVVCAVMILFFGLGVFSRFVDDSGEQTWDVLRAWWHRLSRPSGFSTLSMLFAAFFWNETIRVFALALGAFSHLHEITVKSTVDTLASLEELTQRRRRFATFEGDDLPETR